jgi:hypothetical protein
MSSGDLRFDGQVAVITGSLEGIRDEVGYTVPGGPADEMTELSQRS